MLASEAEATHVEQVVAMVQNISVRVRGMRVRMARGRYVGRVAELEGAIINFDGQIAYLCMVWRADGQGPINGDCASRSYLPSEYFDILDEGPELPL